MAVGLRCIVDHLNLTITIIYILASIGSMMVYFTTVEKLKQGGLKLVCRKTWCLC